YWGRNCCAIGTMLNCSHLSCGSHARMSVAFRFEQLAIWSSAAELASDLHRHAALLEGRKYYRYAEQLRAAALSVSNNIAEGSGGVHPKEFRQYLNIARRSTFENASMLLVFVRMGLFERKDIEAVLARCAVL